MKSKSIFLAYLATLAGRYSDIFYLLFISALINYNVINGYIIFYASFSNYSAVFDANTVNFDKSCIYWLISSSFYSISSAAFYYYYFFLLFSTYYSAFFSYSPASSYLISSAYSGLTLTY